MTKYVLKVKLEIPHNLLDPFAQIDKLFGIFFEKSPSIIHLNFCAGEWYCK